jgi:DNA-binding transcriptional ArsR family regulator
VNYHLRELERAGVVELVEERRRGNCVERLYRASARAYVIDPDVIGSLAQTPEAARDRFSASSLVAVAAEMVRDVVAVRARAEFEGKRISTLAISSDIRFRSAADRFRFGEELEGLITGLVKKFHDEAAPEDRTFRLVAASYPAPPR